MADPNALIDQQINEASALIAAAEPRILQLRTDTQNAAQDAERADTNVAQAGRRLSNAAADTRVAAQQAYDTAREDSDRTRDLYNRLAGRLAILETQMQQYQSKLIQATLAKNQLAVAAPAGVPGAGAVNPAAAAAAAAHGAAGPKKWDLGIVHNNYVILK